MYKIRKNTTRWDDVLINVLHRNITDKINMFAYTYFIHICMYIYITISYTYICV